MASTSDVFDPSVCSSIRLARALASCRGPEVNYWSVAYVEINKADNTIATFSMDEDNTGGYTAGLYGDSVKSWDGTPFQELFYEQFIPENIMGASEEQIDSYEPMHGNVDAYTGATVTRTSPWQTWMSI